MKIARKTPPTLSIIGFTEDLLWVIDDDGGEWPVVKWLDIDGDEIDDPAWAHYAVAGRDRTWFNIPLSGFRSIFFKALETK